MLLQNEKNLERLKKQFNPTIQLKRSRFWPLHSIPVVLKPHWCLKNRILRSHLNTSEVVSSLAGRLPELSFHHQCFVITNISIHKVVSWFMTPSPIIGSLISHSRSSWAFDALMFLITPSNSQIIFEKDGVIESHTKCYFTKTQCGLFNLLTTSFPWSE